MTYQRISIAQAESLINETEATLLDIRDRQSYEAGNVKNSIHVTNENVEDVLNTLDKDKPVIIYCYHGNSSQGAADYFFNMGCKKAYSVDGGFEEWKHQLS